MPPALASLESVMMPMSFDPASSSNLHNSAFSSSNFTSPALMSSTVVSRRFFLAPTRVISFLRFCSSKSLSSYFSSSFSYLSFHHSLSNLRLSISCCRRCESSSLFLFLRFSVSFSSMTFLARSSHVSQELAFLFLKCAPEDEGSSPS